MTSILLVHPGAAFSTRDVFDGVKAGLEAHGVTVIEYPLDGWLKRSEALVEGAIEAGTLKDPVIPFVLASERLPSIAIANHVDAVLVISGGNVHPAPIAVLRILQGEYKRPFPVAVYCTETPYAPEDSFARFYNIVFTNERKHAGRFPHNKYVEYLPMAYNPAVHRPGPIEDELASDVLFIGTGFEERQDLLYAVDWSGIDFRLMGGFWEQRGAIEGAATLEPEGVVKNTESVRYYRSARINLNLHRTTTIYGAGPHIAPDDAESLGPRAYELAACGAFQLIDDARPEVVDVFGDTLPTFKAWNAGDLERQARYYLARPDARARHARAALEAVRPHTWHARARRMLDVLLNWTPTED